MSEGSSGRERIVTALVLGGVAALFLFRLGGVGFLDPDEGRYAAIPTAMLRSGDYITPRLGGFPYLEKPPLLYWLTAASLRAFGRSEFAARLPVAATGFLGVFAVFFLARRTRGLLTAWLAAGLLALNLQWFVQARFLTTDMILAGFLTLGLCLFCLAAETGRRSLYPLFYGCIALATLAKGIIGFLLPGMIVVCFIAATRRWRLLREMQLARGAALFAAVVLPWFVMIQQRFPVFLRYFLYDQHVARYISDEAEHERPFWFFVPVVVASFFPWIVHLPFALRRRVRAPAELPGRPQGAPVHVFLWVWFLVIFCFFSVSRGKLISYILPALPPLALLVAGLFARLWDPEDAPDAARRVRIASAIAAVVWLVLAPVALFGLPWLVRRDGRLNLDDVREWPWIFCLVWGGGGLAVLVLALMRRVRGALVAQAVVTLALFMTMLGAAAAIEPFMNPRPIGRALAREARPEDLVVVYRIPQQSMEYYIDRPPMLIAFTGEYDFGIRLAPDPELFSPDPAELGRRLASSRRVFVVADKDDTTLPGSLPVPVRIVAQTTKRILYANIPRP